MPWLSLASDGCSRFQPLSVNGVIRAKMRIQMGEDSSPTQREQNAGAFDAEFPCQTSCFFSKTAILLARRKRALLHKTQFRQ